MRRLGLGVLLVAAVAIAMRVWMGIPDTTNRVLNAGFETAGTGTPDVYANWTEINTVVDETVDVHGGGHAMKTQARGPAIEGYVSQTFVVVPGERHRLSFWTHGEGGYPGRYSVSDVTNSAYITDGLQYTGVAGTSWAQVTYDFTVPAGCVSARIAFLPYNDGNGFYAYFDDISLVNLRAATWTLNNDVLQDPPPTWEAGLPGDGPMDREPAPIVLR